MSAIDRFLDADIVALDDVAYALSGEDPRFETAPILPSLVELGTRLPSGLVHAESIWILSARPENLDPLAPDSPWYAIEQSLAVVLSPSRAELTALLADLAHYRFASARVARELADRPDLIDALQAAELAPAAAAELSILLDAPPNLMHALDRYALGLRADLAAMATRSFEPLVRVHASLRARHFRSLGAKIAEQILTRLPRGPFRVALSDGRMLREHLSPYVRDLGHALTAWGIENAERLTTTGLAEALMATRARPSPDLAALVVPDLFAFAPELELERREAEATAGLYLRDEDGITFGHAELARLQLADESTIAPNTTGTIALIAGAPEGVLAEAASVLLDSGRVTGVSCALSAAIDAELAIVADALAGDQDGAKVHVAGGLADRAVRLGFEVHRPGCVAIDDTAAAPRVALELIGLTRRAKAQGRLDEEAPIGVVLFPRARGVRATLTRRSAELISGRLALYLLVSREDPAGVGRSRKSVSQNAPGISRRFRA